MNAAIAMLQGMLGKNGVILNFEGEVVNTYLISLALLAVAWFTPNTQQWLKKYQPALKANIKMLDSSWCHSHSLWQKLYWRPNRIFGFVLGSSIFIIAKIALQAPQSEFLYFDF